MNTKPDTTTKASSQPENARSFKPEVIADSTGKWCGNALRFATREEAESYVHDLMMRWTAVRDTRVIESDDAVTHKIVEGEIQPIGG
jgi:hypothetical protein